MARRKRRKNEGKSHPSPGRETSSPRGPAPVSRDLPHEPVPRRTLLELGLGLCGSVYAGAIGYPVYRYLATPSNHEANVGAVREVHLPWAELPEPGAAVIFRFGGRPTLLIRRTADDFVCLDAVCTHMGCTVRFQPEAERIHCACHGGTYDPATGTNLTGPPPRPLTRYTVEVGDDGLAITRT